MTDTYTYDGFGNVVAQTETTPSVYLYRREYYDPDLGMYYLRARWLNVQSGRFVQADAHEGAEFFASTLHRYTYANVDLVNYADPSGRSATVETGTLDGFDIQMVTEGLKRAAKIATVLARARRSWTVYEISLGVAVRFRPEVGICPTRTRE